MPKPVGELKKLVSLVDRGDADEFLYPAANDRTVFQQDFKSYHNFSQETIELPYTGAADWGQRITFTMPYPWLGDCLSWIAIRFSPNTWLSDEAVIGLSNPDADKRSIIFNEYNINWDSTVYLVEGAFDHIVTPNSIPILGKYISDKLFHALQTRCKSDVVIVLDGGAEEKKDTKVLYRKLNSVNLYSLSSPIL